LGFRYITLCHDQIVGDDGRNSMRKVIAVELVSLDGVMESPEEWDFSYSNEMEEANASGMAASVEAVRWVCELPVARGRS
jgi:hypothetical protein